jgi:hypothetical protein
MFHLKGVPLGYAVSKAKLIKETQLQYSVKYLSYTNCHLFVMMLNVVLSVIFQTANVLSVVMMINVLIVIITMLNVIMLNFVMILLKKNSPVTNTLAYFAQSLTKKKKFNNIDTRRSVLLTSGARRQGISSTPVPSTSPTQSR